ncbi:MAG TPA: carbamoyl phosphate synthase large subunit, partial [bacterium]|nr:carbamoyl phosphate synthase large subunit [bacterium]
VFPFNRFAGVDAVLGPEMKSTGEVIGIDESFEMAYAKSQLAAGQNLPVNGNIFISVQDRHKDLIYPVAKGFVELGFHVIATAGTGKFLSEKGLSVTIIGKIYESVRPNVIDLIKNNQIQMIINTPSGTRPKMDIISIRTIAIHRNIPLITTVRAAHATLLAIKKLREHQMQVKDIKQYHQMLET